MCLLDVKKLMRLCWLIGYGSRELTQDYVLTQSKHNQVNQRAAI